MRGKPYATITKEWKKKMFIYAMKKYSIIRNNEILVLVTAWVKTGDHKGK
jgi:hypothetical protein